jgi:hypothetical protein
LGDYDGVERTEHVPRANAKIEADFLLSTMSVELIAIVELRQCQALETKLRGSDESVEAKALDHLRPPRLA